MKHTNLFILLSLVFTGLCAQQEENILQTEDARQIETEVFIQQELQISETEYSREVSLESQLTPQVLISYSYSLQYPIEKYESMILRGKELTDKLIEHDKIMQNESRTKAQIKEWKRDLLEAKLLGYRIDEYTTMYKRENYPLIEYVNKEVLNNYDDFSKMLDTATQYAGF